MKTLLLLTLLILCAILVNAQRVTIIVNGSETPKDTKIQAYSETMLFSTDGKVPLTDIDTLKVLDTGKQADALLQHASKRGVLSMRASGEIFYPQSQLINEETKLIDIPIEKYVNESRTARSFELIGMLVIGGSFILNAVYQKQLKDDLSNGVANPENKTVSPIVPGIGLLMVSIGISIDISSKRLLLPAK